MLYDRGQNIKDKVELSPIRYYDHTEGYWVLHCYEYSSFGHKRFLNLLKTIDSLLRKATNFSYPIIPKIKTKWITSTINEEIRKWQETEREAKRKKLDLDISQLGCIRADASEIKEKLLTNEEIAEEISELISEETTDSAEDGNVGFKSLSSHEKRYLQCLLEETSTNWINSEGLLSSLLCDSINEKLYDIFADTVLENGEIIEDYKEGLKEGLFI